MRKLQKYAVKVTTAADGSATAYFERITGLIHEISYVKTDFAAGVDFTITTETGGKTVWTESNVNASATRMPRQPAHSTAGVAATYDGTVPVLDKIGVVAERIKVVIAQGGDTKTGTFYLLVETP